MSYFFHTYPFVIPCIVWAITQLLKFCIRSWKRGAWDMRSILGSGGMPSVHTSFIISITSLVALWEGISSLLFAAMAVVSLIVVYDALHVRYQVGIHARIMNTYLATVNKKTFLPEDVGHTISEVLVGGILGVVLTLFLVFLP